MKKLTALFTALVIAMLILTACGPRNEGESQYGTAYPGIEATSSLPGTGATEAVTSEPTGTAMATVETGVTETPVSTEVTPTQAAAQATNTPAAGQSGGGLPSTGKADRTRLSSLLTFQVVDRNGTLLGTVDDFVINMCEAHLLYIVLNPDPALNMNAEGKFILVPYQAATTTAGNSTSGNSSSVKATATPTSSSNSAGNATATPTASGQQGSNQGNTGENVIKLNIDASQLQGAPSFSDTELDMTTFDWEISVIDFWSAHMKMGLTTECRVPPAGSQLTATTTPEPNATPVITSTLPVTDTLSVTKTPVAGTGNNSGSSSDRVVVHKIALAKDVLNAELFDGNGNLIGTVEEVLVIPETGRLQYVAVQADASFQAKGRLLLVPLGAVTVRQPETGTAGVALELLVEANVLKNAPGFDSLPDASMNKWDTDVFNYWGQYVPMTQADLP